MQYYLILCTNVTEGMCVQNVFNGNVLSLRNATKFLKKTKLEIDMSKLRIETSNWV